MPIKKTLVVQSELNPFDLAGVRELARATGLDVAYLSRVKDEKIPVSEERYKELWLAAYKLASPGSHNREEEK